jgi:hypothetical protein
MFGTDIDRLNQTAKERLTFPTQNPKHFWRGFFARVRAKVKSSWIRSADAEQPWPWLNA